MKRAGQIALIVLLGLVCGAGRAEIRMGLIGDSMTDEYLLAPNAARTDLAAYSWVQILARLRPGQFDFGSYRAPKDYWPDRRDAGYEYNWAKVGAAASATARLRIAQIWQMRTDSPFMGSAYLDEQAEGLAPYIARGEVDYAFVGAGSNDFFYRTTSFSLTGSAKPLKQLDIDAIFVEDVAHSVLLAVDTLRAAGAVKVMMALIPMGTAEGGGGSPEVLAGIAAANEILAEGARRRGIATVDLFGFARDPARSRPDGSIVIGDRVIPFDSAATDADLVPRGTPGAGACNSKGRCAGPQHVLRYRAEDGLHPNTVIQGLMANEVLKALNAAYGAGIELLTDEEILALTVNQ